MRSAVVLTIFMLAIPAAAQEDPLGIAYAQAPEAGSGICFDTNAGKAMVCAVEACVLESGLDPEFCEVNVWARPSRWVADVFVQSAEGPHWHEFLTGWDSEDALMQAAAIACDRDYLIECAVLQIWDPDGNPVEIE